MRWKAPRNITQWHRWFAWYPVRINGHVVWLETIERKCEFSGYDLFGDSYWKCDYR